jgi:hypothetical protein
MLTVLPHSQNMDCVSRLLWNRSAVSAWDPVKPQTSGSSWSQSGPEVLYASVSRRGKAAITDMTVRCSCSGGLVMGYVPGKVAVAEILRNTFWWIDARVTCPGLSSQLTAAAVCIVHTELQSWLDRFVCSLLYWKVVCFVALNRVKPKGYTDCSAWPSVPL